MPMTMKVAPIVPMIRYWYDGHQRAAVAPERDQHVGRQRRDLEEHEDVERVAGDRDAEQAGQAQHEHRVEEVVLLAAASRPRCWRGCRAAPRPRCRRPAPARRRSAGRPGTRCPRAAASCRWRRRSCRRRPPAATARARWPAPAQLAASATAKARLRRRSSTVSGAAISGTTTCSAGRCAARLMAAVRRRRPAPRPAPGSRLPRWCRRPRGCAPPAPGRAPAWPRRRRWR